MFLRPEDNDALCQVSSHENDCNPEMNEKRRVQHDYHDHARDGGKQRAAATTNATTTETTTVTEVVSSDDEQTKKQTRRGPRGGVAVPFPDKLHHMLTEVSKEGLDHIVSWQPHGRCFVVHKAKEFVTTVMPKYFKQTKLTSFQRQLNLYGFCRLTSGKDRGGYYHELFLNGRSLLCKRMMRTRIKGTGIKAASSPSTEPDFYSMPPVTNCTHDDNVADAMMVTKSERPKAPLMANLGAGLAPPPPLMTVSNQAGNIIVTPPTTPHQRPFALSHTNHPSDMSLFLEPEIQPDELIVFEGKHFHYLDPTAFDRTIREGCSEHQMLVAGCDYGQQLASNATSSDMVSV